MKSFNQKSRKLILILLSSLSATVLFTNCADSGFTSVVNTDGDPLLKYAWYIKSEGQKVFADNQAKAGFDLNLTQTWANGYSGKGIRILVSDDGVEDTHEDLRSNFLYASLSKDYTKPAPYTGNTSGPATSADNHGTAVAGLIAAVANNGVGTKGVAFGSSISSANFLSSATTTATAYMVDQATGPFDIFNMSWGSTQNELVDVIPSFLSQLRNGALNLRNGKGAIYVKAAGNDYAVYCNGSTTEVCIGNAGFDSDNRTPFTILTAALSPEGVAASYSSMGSNIWISSFGGEYGDDYPAMISTDRMGCSKGFAKSSSTSDISFQRGTGDNPGCNYTATFNGTSSAAPVLTGVIALMLEANPDLTWRDVKYILAKTADPVNHVTTGSIAHPNITGPPGSIWERVWIKNGADFNFHNYYGFGKVNVDNAVTMAKSYVSSFAPFQELPIVEKSGLALAIPDFNASGASDTIMVGSNIKIESVQLRVYITHPNISDLALELTSPAGTKSFLINMNNALRGFANFDGEIFLSNAFYQESSAGTWTLKVIDGKTGSTGTVTQWGLYFTGGN